MAIDGFGAVMAIEVSAALVTVSEKTVEVTPPSDAPMLVEPTAIAVASPFIPMGATPLLDELQVT